MKATIVKEFIFHSAHWLYNHPGKCKKLHGHTYKLQVGITGEVHTETGMVIDFVELKKQVGSLVDKLDHECLNEVELPNFPTGLPTAENMVVWFAEYISNQLLLLPEESPPSLAFVRLWETATSFAQYPPIE